MPMQSFRHPNRVSTHTHNLPLFINTRWLIQWAFILTCQLGHADVIQVSVNPAAELGALPRLFRPSVMMSWAQPEAVSAFMALPGDFGTIRITLEPLIQQMNSQDAYDARLNHEAPQLAAISKRNAEIFVTVARMPSWLASSQDSKLATDYGYPIREALPPQNQAAYSRFVEDTVNILNQKNGLKPWYEFWNEPDLDGFWRGTREQIFTTYGSFVEGARKADGNARVGGLCTSGWYQKGPGAKVRQADNQALLADFLQYTQELNTHSAKSSIDFVCWHNFGSHPEQEWWGAKQVSEWLEKAGLKNLPQVVTEWNRWSTFPAWLDPQRDTEVGAAYLATSLHAMDKAGIAMQTFATLQDYSPSKTGDPYAGDFGLLTKEPMLEKASFNVMRMLALLESKRIMATFPKDEGDAEGLNVIATKNGPKIAMMISRYGNDFPGAFIRSLDHSGFPKGKGINISAAQLDAFAKGENELNKVEANPPAKDALLKARKLARLAQHNAHTTHQITLDIAGQSSPIHYRIYLVDSEHGNPAAAYHKEIASGHTGDQALIAAKAVTFNPVFEGTGKLPQIPMQPYSVALVLTEPAGSK